MRLFAATSLLTRVSRCALLPAPVAVPVFPAVQAAEESIVTDRPGFCGIERRGRRWPLPDRDQHRPGERSKRDGVTSKTRSALLRIGLSDSWSSIETEGSMSSVIGPGFQQSRPVAEPIRRWASSGTSRTATKPAANPACLVSSMSTSIPAHRPSGDSRPASLGFVAEWDLPGGMSLGVMPGIFVERNDEGQRCTAALFVGRGGQTA